MENDSALRNMSDDQRFISADPAWLKKQTKDKLIELHDSVKKAALTYQDRYLGEIDGLQRQLRDTIESEEARGREVSELQSYVAAEQAYGNEISELLREILELADSAVHFEPNEFNNRIVTEKLTDVELRVERANRRRSDRVGVSRVPVMTPRAFGEAGMSPLEDNSQR